MEWMVKRHLVHLDNALMDAQYAETVVLITDNLKVYPNTPASIKQTQVDYVVEVSAVGNPDKIGFGATRFTKNPKELKIAKAVNDVIVNSPYFKEGLVEKIMDVQDFDRGVAESMHLNKNQQEINASWYANPANKGAVVNELDIVILSALEIDTDFNVNVISGSDGVIRGAIGGHPDASMAKLTIISAPLVRGRIATVVPSVTTVVTPGNSIDVLVTEIGIAINPKRQDLLETFKQIPGIAVYTIEELQQIVEKRLGKPAALEITDRVVALIEYRDGTIIDVIREIKD